MFRYIHILLIGILISLVSAEEWALLGERNVDRRLDTDIIDVGKQEGFFNELRIHVKEEPIHIFNVNVHFENETTYRVDLQQKIAVNNYSKVIDLPGKNRRISFVKLSYRTTSPGKKGFFWRRGKGKIQLLGKRKFLAEDPYEFQLKWIDLGTKRVGYWHDRDVIKVTKQEGDFRAVRLEVSEADVYIRDYTLLYISGRKTTVEVNRRVQKDAYTMIQDLPGADRFIQKVTLRYSSLNKTRAKVTLWGLQEYSAIPEVKKETPVVVKEKRKRAREYRLTRKWNLLGKERANLFTEKDVIKVTGAERFAKQIQIRVFEETVFIWDLKVYFANGSLADISVRTPIQPGFSTRVIDLPGNLRKISRIELLHRTEKDRNSFRQKKALVEVWAK